MSNIDSVVLDEVMDEGAEADLDELKKGAVKKKGRGFDDAGQKSNVKDYEALGGEDGHGGQPQRSVEEAQEEEVKDLFKEYGNVMNMHLNLDRRTGYFKGYAIVQYESQQEASDAISGLNGFNFLGQNLAADWSFIKGGRDGKKR